ncbi:MAG: hypothetical protein RR326_05530, partial [Stenotrophomonas sp.]
MKMTILALSLMAAMPAVQAEVPDAAALPATTPADASQAMVPQMSERDQNVRLEVKGFRVLGVVDHPQ